MTTTFKTLYSAGGTAITLTGTSLANSSSLSTGYRQSASVDNTTNEYLDAHIFGHVKSGGTPTVNAIYTLFGYWSYDGGTTYSNNATGSDAAYTQPDSDQNMIVLATSVCTATASLVSYFPPFSFCQKAGLLYLPSKWGIILKNGSGTALSATSTDHVFAYQGINTQGV